MKHADYFKVYRKKFGFSSQGKTEVFLKAKDIISTIDYDYIIALNCRLKEIVIKLNSVVHESAKRNNLDLFIEKTIFDTYSTIKDSGLIPKLNNQGRRPEEVLFSWLRGYTMAEYFTPAISHMLDVQIESVMSVGDDDFKNKETFKRTPKADFEIKRCGQKVRVEVQSGFQGINDVKEHKVREAVRLFKDKGIPTVCFHFDIFNGQAAFIDLSSIESDNINWIVRKQMESQIVFAIDQNYFKWRFLEEVPSFETLELSCWR